MAANYITVVAKITSREGKERETKSALMTLLKPTRQEEGCLQYDLHSSSENPGEFLFFERWTNKEALAKHLETPHILALRARGEELLAKPTEITIWTEILE